MKYSMHLYWKYIQLENNDIGSFHVVRVKKKFRHAKKLQNRTFFSVEIYFWRPTGPHETSQQSKIKLSRQFWSHVSCQNLKLKNITFRIPCWPTSVHDNCFIFRRWWPQYCNICFGTSCLNMFKWYNSNLVLFQINHFSFWTFFYENNHSFQMGKSFFQCKNFWQKTLTEMKRYWFNISTLDFGALKRSNFERWNESNQR